MWENSIENLRGMIYNEHGAIPVTLLDNLKNENHEKFDKVIKGFIKEQETQIAMNNIVTMLYRMERDMERDM